MIAFYLFLPNPTFLTYNYFL